MHWLTSTVPSITSTSSASRQNCGFIAGKPIQRTNMT